MRLPWEANMMITKQISTDLRGKNALVRRALAYDQCGLMEFKIQETWITRMFQAMAEPPRTVFHPTTFP